MRENNAKIYLKTFEIIRNRFFFHIKVQNLLVEAFQSQKKHEFLSQDTNGFVPPRHYYITKKDDR